MLHWITSFLRPDSNAKSIMRETRKTSEGFTNNSSSPFNAATKFL